MTYSDLEKRWAVQLPNETYMRIREWQKAANEIRTAAALSAVGVIDILVQDLVNREVLGEIKDPAIWFASQTPPNVAPRGRKKKVENDE